MTIVDQIKHQFKTGSELTRVIYINLAFFLFMLLVKIVGNFGSGPGHSWQLNVEYWLALPSDPLTFITRPWTIVTYMFLHVDFWHLFWNLVLLYFTGSMFLEYLGGKRFLTAYVGGGLAGGLLYFIVANLSSSLGDGILLGASAGVWGVVAAIAIYVPNLPVRLFFAIQVKLWQVVLFLFISDLMRFANFENPGGMLAHFGGALFGYFLISQLKKGTDFSDTAYAYVNAISGIFKAKPKLRTVHKSKTSSPKKSTTAGDQQKLDAILDKIKITGYDKLSKDEKEFLFKFGKK